MSEDFVTFNIRCEKSFFGLKIKAPEDVSGFIEKLKIELKLEETDELVILCPTSDGKMMEIQSNDDIEFLKKTKLAYNAVSKEIYCNVELVVIIIHKLPENDAQMMILSNKVNQLGSKIDELTDEIKTMRSSMDQNSEIDSGNFLKKNSSGEQSKPNLSNLESKNGQRQKKTKKDKEKVPITTTPQTIVIDDSSTVKETIQLETPTPTPRIIPKDIDLLLEMLVSEGYTNTIQNIIVLKRFDNDYEKAINYLKSSN